MQGLQRQAILLSFVRTGKGWNPGQMEPPRRKVINFLDDMRRLCVALSWSRHLLIIVGHRELLEQTPAMDVIAKWFPATGRTLTIVPDSLLPQLGDPRTPQRFAYVYTNFSPSSGPHGDGLAGSTSPTPPACGTT